MEAVIFVGIQASGKSTFYRERFFATLRVGEDGGFVIEEWHDAI